MPFLITHSFKAYIHLVPLKQAQLAFLNQWGMLFFGCNEYPVYPMQLKFLRDMDGGLKSFERA